MLPLSHIQVICLENQEDIWLFANRNLGGESGATLIRSAESPAKITAVADRLEHPILLSRLGFLNTHPWAQVRQLCFRKLRMVVVLEMREKNEAALPYIRAGCSGILHFQDSPEHWRKALTAVAEGDLWVSRTLLNSLVREALLVDVDPTHKITQREAQILELIGLGHDNESIAEELFISKETVRWHVRSLYSKLGIGSRRAAVKIAREYLLPKSTPVEMPARSRT